MKSFQPPTADSLDKDLAYVGMFFSSRVVWKKASLSVECQHSCADLRHTLDCPGYVPRNSQYGKIPTTPISIS
jgi:hypothetical protein